MPDIFSSAEKAMGMDDRVWARHGNPLSVYSRLFGAVPIFLAIWSVHWIGWLATIPIVVMAVWTWANPRLFPPPQHANAWATKVVLGERVFLNRKNVPIPEGHARANWITTMIAVAFMALFVYAFITRNLWAGVGGWFGAVIAKLWFVDRCVWLWEEMKAKDPTYAAWARAEWRILE